VTQVPRLVAIAILVLGATAAFAVLRSDVATSGSDPPRFVEVAAIAGLDHVYDGEFPFFVGGGVAVFDCDADRFPDLYIAGGVNDAALFVNRSVPGGPLRFAAHPDPLTDMTGVVGAYPLDIDGDALIDLVVLRHGENVILRGTGDCAFEPANARWQIDGGEAWSTAFSAAWEAPSALPTLAFGNYVRLDEAGNQVGGCWDNILLRPEETTYADPTALAPSHCTLSMLFSDWNRSGVADLRVSNDRQYYREGQEQLWRMTPGGAPALYTTEHGWADLQIFGMGIASYDVTGDGYPEVYLTSMGDNKLQTLQDGARQPLFTDIALERGATAHRPFFEDAVAPSTGWHAEFEDLNNDSFIDLFVTKGNVEAMAEAAMEDPNNLLLGQPDGSFSEGAAEAGLVNTARTRGAGVVDLNLDGLLDIVEVNRRTPVTIWQNLGGGAATDTVPMGNWIQLSVTQPGANRDAVGAWIEVGVGGRTQRREVTVGGGHAGGQLGWIHFGLGDETAAEVRVEWPDGELGQWHHIESSSFVIIDRADSAPIEWIPGGP